MKHQRPIVLGAALTFGMMLSTFAAGASLDVNTGLWEVSSTGETSGTPPIPAEALARMPPEQRAQMQAAIASAMAQSNKPTIARLCITQKTLQRGMDFNQRESANCERSVMDSSSSKMNIRMECTGDETMNGTFHIEALNRQAIRGSLHMVVSNGGNAMTVNRDIQGKWLASNCGSVKPADE